MSPLVEAAVARLTQAILQVGEEVALPALEKFIADLEAKIAAPAAEAIDRVVDLAEDAKFPKAKP